MKEDKASEMKSGNKGLVILLCMLVVVIVGLGVGIGVVVNFGLEDQLDVGIVDSDIDMIILEHQEKIDAAENDEEKKELYEERYYAVTDAIEQGDMDYCTQASDDLGELFVLEKNKEKLSDIINKMPKSCIQGGEEELTTVEDYTDNGGEA